MLTGTIYNIQRYSLHDGPGIRTTVFFKGCPLGCWWCHNPESQRFDRQLIFWQDRCIGCGDCTGACPNDAIDFTNGRPSILHHRCRQCGQCAKKCPAGAWEMIGSVMTVSQVMQQIQKDLLFFDQSNGGVTFSGGEPLMQPEFLERALEECKKAHIHTAVDTSGYTKWPALERISALTDLFLYDIKHIDGNLHKKYTNVDNGIILENLKRLSKIHSGIIIRVPVIPGINNSSDTLTAISELALSLGIGSINLLPYHNTGMDKYGRLGLTYRLADTKEPSAEQMEALSDIMRSLGLNIKIGG